MDEAQVGSSHTGHKNRDLLELGHRVSPNSDLDVEWQTHFVATRKRPHQPIERAFAAVEENERAVVGLGRRVRVGPAVGLHPQTIDEGAGLPDVESAWRETPMRFVDNDRWAGAFTPSDNARYLYTIEATAGKLPYVKGY